MKLLNDVKNSMKILENFLAELLTTPVGETFYWKSD